MKKKEKAQKGAEGEREREKKPSHQSSGWNFCKLKCFKLVKVLQPAFATLCSPQFYSEGELKKKKEGRRRRQSGGRDEGKREIPHHHHHQPASSGSKGIAEELMFEVGNNHLLREHVGLPDRRMVGAPARTCGNTCTATMGKQTVHKHTDKAACAHTHTLCSILHLCRCRREGKYSRWEKHGVRGGGGGGGGVGKDFFFFLFLKPGAMNFEESVFGSKLYPGVIRRS